MANEISMFAQFSGLIGQSTRVKLRDGTSTDGVLYCIDPATDHVALLYPLGDGNSGYAVKIVLAHHVRGIEKRLHESTDSSTLATLQQKLGKGSSNDSQEEATSIQRRREQLVQFLNKNFVPCDDAVDGSIRVFGGAALVHAPFRAVHCANEQLLRRMQQLLTQFGQEQYDPPA